jgi:hypothetical protein
MTASAQHNIAKTTLRVSELLTEATVEALNSALSEKGIAPEAIVSILDIPGQNLINSSPAQFRVLYRS